VKRGLMTVIVVFALVMVAGTIFAQAPAAEKAPAAPAAEVAKPAAPAAEVQGVESSLIKEVAYDAATKVLTVQFVDKPEKYQYKDVPEEVYNALMTAESKGAFFVKNIKDKFEFTKE
jgi:hypothetical protein